MGSFRVLNFGCRANQADGATLRRQMIREGWQEADTTNRCDVALLNSCTVTARADAELRQIIRRIHRQNPECKILVTGCYAQRAPDELAQMEGVTWVVGNSHKEQVHDLFRPSNVPSGFVSLEELQARKEAEPSIPPEIPFELPFELARAKVLVGDIFEQKKLLGEPFFSDTRTRPTLKIQDGCNARCSFCIIPYVRGNSRSLPPEKILEQARQLSRSGYREVVLSGINLGSYGKDLGRSLNFVGLLERLLSETDLARIRISSIEPMDVTPELIRLVATDSRMARHFHVPLQSGCNRILRLMNRRYWTSQYAERIEAIRERMPDAAIGADIMVGFPGETEEDHRESVQLIESLPFTYVHVFPYSLRTGTPAGEMPAHVNGRVAKERSREIRALVAAKHIRFLEEQLGRTLSVLTLDRQTGEGPLGLSSNYLKVLLSQQDTAGNRLVDTTITGRRNQHLLGSPVSSHF